MGNNKEPFNGLSEEKLKILWEDVYFPLKFDKKPPFEPATIPPLVEPAVPADYRPMIWKKGSK